MIKAHLARFFSVLFLAAPAAASEPQLSVSIEPEQATGVGVYVQSQIKVKIQLVSEHPYDELNLQLPTLTDVRTIVLRQPHNQEVNLYGYKGYVYETTLALFPKHSGLLRVPPVSIAGAVDQGRGKIVAFDKASAELSLTIRPQPLSYDRPWWLVAGEATMLEEWSAPTQHIRVEDSVRRSITLTVHGVTAEHLPLLEQPAGAGYSVVGSRHERKTRTTVEGVLAILRQSWDIRIEARRITEIQPVLLDYWDVDRDQLATVGVPPQRIEPLPRNGEQRRAELLDKALAEHSQRRTGLLIALTLPALILVTLLLISIYHWLPSRADRRLLAHCRGVAARPPESENKGENENEILAIGCYQAIKRWSRHGGVDIGTGGEASLQLQLGALRRTLFAETPAATPLQPNRLAQALVATARRQRLAQFWRRLVSYVTAQTQT